MRPRTGMQSATTTANDGRVTLKHREDNNIKQ